MTVTLRDARPEDAARVIALLTADNLEVAFVPAETRVAVRDGRVVGSARLKPLHDGSVELASVVVDPAVRGEGVGARLVEDALARAPGRVVGLALQPAFFERFGFQRLDAVPEPLRGKADDQCSTAVPIAHDGTSLLTVRARYADAARSGGATSVVALASRGYAEAALADVPEDARFTLGTGNPIVAADLKPGETVVDLGSGAGLDALLAVQAVGPEGRVIGVDFTPEMLARARKAAEKAGATNVAFTEAAIDATGLPDATADVIVSNCVINLAEDKPKVLAEALRVLKPGGRFVVSDTLREEDLPPGAPTCDCTGGALSLAEWRAHLEAAGFVDVDLTPETLDDGCCGSNDRVLVRAKKKAL